MWGHGGDSGTGDAEKIPGRGAARDAMSGAAIIGGALALGGYAAACRLTGENLLATWWDEWRLARVSAEQLAAEAAANPRESGLVVTLTTIPSRLGAIGPTVKSLLRQTARAREIRLCVPAWSEREQCAYEVPAWLRTLPGVTITACADEGPATKFLPTLRAVAPEQAVVVVDDDRSYHRRLLEEYARLARAFPDRALGAAGWRVPADLVDRPTTLHARLAGARHVPRRAHQLRAAERTDILQGVHSYLVRPEFFDLAKLGDFSSAPAALRYVDDVWVSAHCRAEKWLHPMALGYTDFQPWAGRPRFRATALGATVNRARRDEDRGNSVALRHFAAQWHR